MTVAIITRKSSRDEHKVSVGRQEAMGREWAKTFRPGLPVAVFEDNATSGVVMDRPGWLAFVKAVQSGQITDVWAYEQSRITRAGGGAWKDVCVLLSSAGIREVHTTRQGSVSVVEGDRIHGSINSLMDEHEREVLRVRTLDGLKHAAADGRPGAATGYGYRRTYNDDDGKPILTPDPDEAARVVEMVKAIAAGDSLGVVAARMNAQGVPTPRGAKEWRRESVRAIVTSGRIAGLRVHQSKIIGPAKWPAIVDRKLWERAQARLLMQPPGTIESDRRRRLLTGGLAVCDACDTALIASTTLVRGVREPSYQCPHPSRPEKGCGKCSILADRLEGYVCDRITDQLADPGFTAALNDYLRAGSVDTTPIHDELERIEGRLADLAVVWASGDFIEIEHATARRTLLEERAKLMGQLAQTPVEEYTVDDVLDAWAAGGIARRPLIPVLCEPIRVAGAFRDGRRLTLEERVKVTFR